MSINQTDRNGSHSLFKNKTKHLNKIKIIYKNSK